MFLNVLLRPGFARRVLFVALPASACLLWGAALAQTTVVGKIPGEFAVSPSGAATYRIPIEVPPGVAGMQPELALSYNSQAGNGIMGMGWSIEGLSAITRCPKTLSTDGVRGSVNFNIEDRFCLDGQRLINVAGAYGAAGSEYRTELESFSRITAHGAAAGSAANGPERFTVQTKAGLTLEYGATADSRIEAQGKGVVRVWALSQMRDAKGNLIDYRYAEDNANGEFNIAAITYAGDRGIAFEYESRPDILTGFEVGGKTRQSVRLSRIRSSLASQVHQLFSVTYSEDSSGLASFPKEFKRCSLQVCALETALQWSSAGTPNFGGVVWNVHGGGASNNALGDFNGDGRTDMAAHNGGATWQVCLSTASGFDCRLWGAHGGGPSNNVLGDFNGDGRTDMAAYTGSGGMWHVCLSTGSGFDCSALWAAHGGGASNNVLGDFNGDGRTDMAAHYGGATWQVCLSTGSGFDCGLWGAHGGGSSNNVLGDFNGDGRTDMAAHYGGATWQVCLSTGSGFDCSALWAGHGGGSSNNVLGDFNGDGRTDMAAHYGGATWQVCLSTGSGFDCSALWAAHGGGPSNNVLGDFNGDGRTDMAAYTGSGGIWHVCLSTGIGFDCGSWVGHGGGRANNALGDFNGDGRTDMAGYAGGSSWHVTLSQSNAQRVLQGISRGSEFIAISKEVQTRLAANGGYTGDPGSTYPLRDIGGALMMVKSVDVSNGLGGFNRTTYSYGGLKAEQASAQHPGSGRGMLGFRWMKTLEEATGIETYTEFSQSWPTIGSVLKSETRLAGAGNAGLLKQSTSSYGCHQTAAMAGTSAPASATAACGPWSPGKVYFPHLVSAVEDSWDLDGSAMPRLSTSQSYAGYADQSGGVRQYGDPTQIRVDIHQGGALQHRKDTTNEYHPAKTSAGQWQLGRLKKASVSSTQN